ncbi:hypothetical protein KC19_8G147300 [Ceratodon purpureus]|uniref:THIF-type NAD/FAD binding fold domain-containing protein n=1 Tax=Ceratodon purpureus TaxID=3225 RepID=A0A8T0GYK3_CERPU|nr:hypothetical protein KC19_8G147300 [Ceratodon purpureus]
MGVGCSSNGNISVTDMDTVSKPNLIDQVLYQPEDVSRAKAPTAARALRTINPAAQIHALQVYFRLWTLRHEGYIWMLDAFPTEGLWLMAASMGPKAVFRRLYHFKQKCMHLLGTLLSTRKCLSAL